MAIPLAAMAIPALIGGAGTLIEGNRGRKAAEAAERAALAQYVGINPPTVEEQKLILEMLASQGDLSPEMLQALSLDPAAMESVFASPETIDAQRDSLNLLQEISQSGLTEGDKAVAREIQRQTSSSDMARRKSILNDMAQRGVLGSGAELAAQLQGLQESQESQAEANDRLMKEAQARQLQALSQSGQLAGQMRGQEFGEGSARAEASDAIKRFNLQNQQRVMDTNVGNRNQAQQFNLANKQRIADTNVGLKNAQQQSNKSLLQQQFQNQMQLANARANRQSQLGQTQQAGHNAVATGIGGIASGLTNLFGSQAGSQKPTSGFQITQEDEDWLNK